MSGWSLERRYGAFVVKPDNDGDREYFLRHEGNAKLIAAAPGMLEALVFTNELIKVAREHFPKSMHNRDKFMLENTCAAVSKAIGKARGEL